MANLETMDEAELITRVRTVDRDAYAEVMSRYQSRLLRYAAALLRDEDRAADVVQEAFIRAYTHLHGFNINRSFSSWIYRIVHNEAMNMIKRHRHEQLFPEKFDRAGDTDLEQETDVRLSAAEVRSCLNRLPLSFAEPLMLHYLEEQPYDAIADILHISPGTVASRIARAKKRLLTICRHQ